MYSRGTIAPVGDCVKFGDRTKPIPSACIRTRMDMHDMIANYSFIRI